MERFLVVAFINSKEVEIVPKTWLFYDNGKLYTYWPNVKDMSLIHKNAELMTSPDTKRWRKYSVRKLKGFGKCSLT